MRDAVAQLEARIRELRRGNAFLPIAVVVPSHLLGSWLAPRIFAGTGHLGVSFLLLPDLAWRVAEGKALAQGLGPVPENVDVALGLASAADAARPAETPGYLKEAVEKAGFGPALLRTLQDLGGCGLGPEELDRLAPGSADAERLRLLARTARGFAGRLETARLLDRPAIYRLAATALPSPAVGGVVLIGFDDPPPVAADFLVALRQNHPFAVVPEAGPLALAPRHDARRRAVPRAARRDRRAGGAARADFVAPAPPAAPLRAPRRHRQRHAPRRDRARPRRRRRSDGGGRDRPARAAGDRRGHEAGRGSRPPPRPRPLRRAARLGLRAGGHPGVLRGGRAARRPGGAGPRPAARPRGRGPRAPRGDGVPDHRAHPVGGPPRQGGRDEPRRAGTASPRRPGSSPASTRGAPGSPRRARSARSEASRTTASSASTTASCVSSSACTGTSRPSRRRAAGATSWGRRWAFSTTGSPQGRLVHERLERVLGAARPLRPRADPRGLPGARARAAGEPGLPRGLDRGRPRPRLVDRRRARAQLPPRLRSRPRRARVPDRRPTRPAPPRRGARGALAGASHHAGRAGAGAAPLRARRPRGGGAPRALLPALRHRLGPRARAVVLPAAGRRGRDGPARGRGRAHEPRVAGRDRPRPAAPRPSPTRPSTASSATWPSSPAAAPAPRGTSSTATASWPPRSRSSARPGSRG